MKKIQKILGWPATKEQIHEAIQYVPDELILNITATGTPEEAKARVEDYKSEAARAPSSTKWATQS